MTEHLDEKRRSIEGYQSFADKTAGELSHSLLLLYKKVIEQSLLKRSKRLSSSMVRVQNYCASANDSLFVDNAMVVYEAVLGIE